MIEPVDPFQRGKFDGLEMLPRALPTNHFSFEETDDAFGERVVEEPPLLPTDRAIRASASRLGKASRRTARRESPWWISPLGIWPQLIGRLFERVEHEVSGQGGRDAPADDAAGAHVDDQGDVDEAAPGRHEREVGDRELIRPRRREVPIGQVAREHSTNRRRC
jgi:hypothetical protein